MVNHKVIQHLSRFVNSILANVQFTKRSAHFGWKPLAGLVIVLAASLVPSSSIAQTAPDAKADSKLLQKLSDALGALEQKVNDQQKEIQALKSELKQSAEQLQQTKDQLKPQPAETESRGVTAKYVEANEVTTKESGVRTEGIENPLALRYKKLSIIPGGFIAAETVFRTHNENSDMGSNLGGVPFDGTANSNLSEFHASARATRGSVLLKTNYHDVGLSGFAELDFFGVTAANDIKSNSYSPRQRQLWFKADMKHGWSFTGGQMWSLMVRHKYGMSTLQEDSAPGDLIEGSFVLGHVWERQTGFRIVKNFNDKVWLGFSAENPETTYSSTNIPVNMFGLNTSTNAASPSSDIIPFATGVTNGFSTNLAPDLIAKINFEPGWGHYELKGMYRYFRTRNNATNYSAYGAGFGISTKMPLTKKLDFITEGLVGEGIGRYGSGGGPDITLHPDGSPVPVKQLHLSAGLEYRPNRKLSVFAYEGNEYYQRAAYLNANGLGIGYGSPLVSNAECQVEVPDPNTPICVGQNRDLNQVIAGFWYRFFRSPYGTLQYGINYEHLHRNTWWAVSGEPKGRNDIVMTSMRFVLP